MAPKRTNRRIRIRKNKNKTKKTQKRIRFLLQKGGLGPASYAPFETTPGEYVPVAYAPTIGATADPSDPSNVVSVRMQPNMVGGKKSRKSTRKTRPSASRRIRGGADSITDVQTSSIPYSFLTSSGAQVSANVIQGVNTPELNPSTTAFRPAILV